MKKSRWINSLVAAFAIVFFVGCSKSPSDTVEAWHEALCNQKVDEANKYSTTRVQALNGIIAAGIKENGNNKDVKDFKSWEVVKEEINGNKAVVTIKYNTGKTDTIDLVKEDGEWKVDVQK